MADAKTKPTWASVREHLATIADPARRADCEALVAMMSRVTGAKPVMWGPTIVGFGSYHYRYDSGREGDACLTGFADRKSEIAIYIVAGFEDSEALIAKLGKCKTTKSCLYVKRLADIDPGVLEALVSRSVAEMRRRYP
ncbi:MAG: DUF1801 domain-containing protein [Burkholderiales bacterium]